MAKPLRFRYSPEPWDEARVHRDLLDDLDRNLGAELGAPWYKLAGPYEARRFDMDNGDTALFAWGRGEAYWLGNTETPRALWQTNKRDWEDVPSAIADWAERELLAELHQAEPWLGSYPVLSRFFLQVLCSKDGAETTRAFFRDHNAGFPDTDRDTALSFYETFLATGVLDPYRHVMAGKLGTSEQLDRTRMEAAMSEFTVAKLLSEAGLAIEPEVAVSTGHAIDFRVRDGEDATLVEVTRPMPPRRRAASAAATAIRETVETKTSGQLDEHGGGVTLFVDCSSFSDRAWQSLLEAAPDVGHRPLIVFRVKPGQTVTGYTKGSVPLGLERVLSK